MTTAPPTLESLSGFGDRFHSLEGLQRYDARLVSLLKEAWNEERRFCRDHLAPVVLEEDRKHLEDRGYLSWRLVRLAGRHGRLSSFLPRFMGGRSQVPMVLMTPLLEETGAVDTAYAGLVGGHGLGLVALMLTLNMRVLHRVAGEILSRERSDRPFLIDCAITEPSAGTDVEEVDLYPRARLTCRARRVQGGAVLNGRKVFISTGHMAAEHVVLLPFDLRDPVNTFACFLVPEGAPGFSLGRKERKMGQWAAPASELVFEECFVPDDRIVMAADAYPEPAFRGKFAMILETVLGITRTMVGAISTGCARGAFERAVELARNVRSQGRPLLCRQWAQAQLAEMHMNVMTARAVYLEATFALLENLHPLVSGALPRLLNTAAAQRVLRNRWSRGLMNAPGWRKAMFRRLLAASPENTARVQAASSLAKVVGSDMAMENAQRAVAFLSQAGLRHDRGVEKFFRDAKLLQIFEGTNQLNRLNIFKHALARHLPGVEAFG